MTGFPLPDYATDGQIREILCLWYGGHHLDTLHIAEQAGKWWGLTAREAEPAVVRIIHAYRGEYMLQRRRERVEA